MRIAKKAKFTRQTYACGASWPPQTILKNLHEDLDRHRGLCATLPDGQLVVGILADDIEIVEESPSTLSVSLAEEIAKHPLVTAETHPWHVKTFEQFAAQIIQRRVEPLERALEEAADDLHKTASACALHPHLKEFARKVEEKAEAAHQALARIKEGR